MLRLGTKADTLAALEGELTCAFVLPQYTFCVADWKRGEPTYFWEEIGRKFQKTGRDMPVLIVRSSALNEDTGASSMAGRFESIADISGKPAFEQAVNDVIASYDDGSGQNQILIQPMLSHVKLCGVAFTIDPNTLGNYYVVNYDETGSTSSITSGNGAESKLVYAFKGGAARRSLWEDGKNCGFMRALFATLSELEELFGQERLDVEFAVGPDDRLYIFQVRPLVVRGTIADFGQQETELQRIEEKIRRGQRKKPFLCGEKTVYGVMPDWNPAEMIGIRPKPLALSLYKEIVTDSVWAYQRDNYGYRNLRSFPLMVDFCGLPYIDVRVSFNSFIPAGLDETISEKLVNYYLRRLEEDPAKHDKVEFEIVFSCYTLDLPERIKILKQYGFSDDETEKIVAALRDVTNNIINHATGLWRKDYEKIKRLEKRYDEIMSGDMDVLEKIYWLLEDCKRYGTLPFAGLARAAFIAVQFLQSLVHNGILSPEDYQDFMNDVSTVSSVMSRDLLDLSRERFLEKYGHLRPGTYDINSPRYDEAPELYFDRETVPDVKRNIKEPAHEHFKLSLKQMHRLKEMLGKNGLRDHILELMDFIRSVIEGREYAKFVFTKNLSQAMQLIAQIGEENGFSREDCAYLDIRCIYGLYTTTGDVCGALAASIAEGKSRYALTRGLTLPPLILEAEDVWGFCYPDTEPNFVTRGAVRGAVAVLEQVSPECDYSGKILLIERADPGYDWIFAKGIKGFVTKYGGANSHMAIRAGELGIPAAVGVGTKQYEALKKADVAELDALAKTIRILKYRQ